MRVSTDVDTRREGMWHVFNRSTEGGGVLCGSIDGHVFTTDR